MCYTALTLDWVTTLDKLLQAHGLSLASITTTAYTAAPVSVWDCRTPTVFTSPNSCPALHIEIVSVSGNVSKYTVTAFALVEDMLFYKILREGRTPVYSMLLPELFLGIELSK